VNAAKSNGFFCLSQCNTFRKSGVSSHPKFFTLCLRTPYGTSTEETVTTITPKCDATNPVAYGAGNFAT
jgi:hypothetical protein